MTYRKPPRRPRYHYRPNDKGKRRCRVHLGCGHNGRVATLWYWTADNTPLFTPIDNPKPVSNALQCCEGCQVEIWRRYEESFEVIE